MCCDDVCRFLGVNVCCFLFFVICYIVDFGVGFVKIVCGFIWVYNVGGVLLIGVICVGWE